MGGGRRGHCAGSHGRGAAGKRALSCGDDGLEFNESGWIGQDGTNSYNGVGGAVAADADNNDGINGGSGATAMGQITGAGTSTGLTGFPSFADIKAKFDAGKPITFSTPSDPSNADVVGRHVYTMTGYNATNQTITLRNPWGSGYEQPAVLTMSFASVQANFSSWASANV